MSRKDEVLPAAEMLKVNSSFPKLFMVIVPMFPVDPSPTYLAAKEVGDDVHDLFEGTVRLSVMVSPSKSPLAFIVRR